jgi:hypothetical protein
VYTAMRVNQLVSALPVCAVFARVYSFSISDIVAAYRIQDNAKC